MAPVAVQLSLRPFCFPHQQIKLVGLSWNVGGGEAHREGCLLEGLFLEKQAPSPFSFWSSAMSED